jgi:RHS repeat-associated protein
MSGSGSSVAAPQIRFFQFENDNLGVFNKSVNLFRGDLNYKQSLLKMPGRKGGAEMDIDISIQYQSNLGEDVSSQNVSAPTGIVGLGWSLPMDRISLQLNGCFSQGSRSYTIASSGIDSALILEKIENGKEYYQTENYEFWRIIYDRTNEQWEVTKENGNTFIYGGGVSLTGKGYNKSKGNSIAWGVKYGNWIGNTLIGGSNGNIKPVQFAREWYLSSIVSPWGEEINYAYNEFERNSFGLIDGAEQFFGDMLGMPYTKAVYLTKITDVFGRYAAFSYAEKIYDTGADENPREYQPPHDLIQLSPASAILNGYQDLYETKFLESIVVCKSSGELLRTLNFEYHPLMNLTDFTGALKGHSYKRYLAAVNSYSPDQSSLPGINFSYYWDTTQPDANLGALQSITIPGGAVAAYTYEMKTLDVCERSITIDKPGRQMMGSDSSVPRVWFGSDFTVMTWYNSDSGKLSLAVYTWLGYWKLWTPDNPIIYDQPLGIDFNSLELIVSESSFGLHFKDNVNAYLFLYGKSQQQAGKWIGYKDAGGSSVNFPSTTVSFSNGSNFIAAMETDVNAETQSITRATWNWYTQQWIIERNVTTVNNLSQALSFACGSEYYFTLEWTPGQAMVQLQLNFLLNTASPTAGWNSGNAITLNNIIVNGTESFIWGVGASMIALAVITADNQFSRNYDLYIIQWDEQYQCSAPYKVSFVTAKDDKSQMPVNISPKVISNRMVVTGEYCLRFNGYGWLVNNAFQTQQPSSLNEYWYSPGDDYLLRTINQPQGVISFELMAYDPNSSSEITAWSTQPILPEPVPVAPTLNPRNAFFPAAGGMDYFCNGLGIYYRGASTGWVAAINKPVFTIVDAIDSTTLINQAPDFMAYIVPDLVHPGNSKTVVLELKNGLVRDGGTVLTQQLYNVHPGSSGTNAFGPGTLLTFPADTVRGIMDFANSFTLYRYANHAIAGNIVHYPVKKVDVADGFGVNYSTAYSFDAASAACDPSGSVIKYFKGTVFPGTTDPSQPVYGSVVHHYINGYNNKETITYYLNGKECSDSPAYPVLDGVKKSVEFFDNYNVLIKSQESVWDVFTWRNTDPVHPATANVYGAYTRQHGLVQLLDGVQESLEQHYVPDLFEAPFSGMIVQQSKSNFNGQGISEQMITRKKYGYEFYPELAAIHQLNVVIQDAQTITPLGQSIIPVGAKVNTWKAASTGKWTKYQTIKWNGSSELAFPFPQDYSIPAGWLCADTNESINELGLVCEMSNGQQQMSAVLYDKNAEFVIAQFRNASIQAGEADYFGFEAIESGTGWSMNGNANIVEGFAYTGFRSVSLGSGGSLSKTFTLNAGKKFVAGYWYKTSPGYPGTEGSGWSISGGNEQSRAYLLNSEKAFNDTKGLWQFDCITIDTSSVQTGQPLSLIVKATNTADQQVWIDNVRWVPATGDFTAFVYHPLYNQVTAQIGSGAFLERVFYDRFNRRLATTIPGGDILSTIYLQYMSRQQNLSFNPADPNADIQLKGLNGGLIETFTDEFQWQQNWNASNATVNWQTSNGQINHTNASENDTLSYIPDNLNSDFALSFVVCANNASNPPVLNDVFGIQLGNHTSLLWNPSTQLWQFTVLGKSQPSLWNTTGTPLSWNLIVKPETLIFFADGRLLLSVITHQAITDLPVITTGRNQVSLNFLAVALKPMTGLVYKDGMGNSRQNQALVGANAMINQQICNPLGKTIVKTKSAPAIFGSIGNNISLLSYKPGFVNLEAFLGDINGTGMMQGEVSDYFNGSNGAGDDEGYPYSRKLLEFSPLSRVIEKGAPGKNFAIINPLAPGGSSRKTVKYQYTNNKLITVAGLEDLPSGEYFVTVMTQQNGVSVYQVKDKTSVILVKGMPADISSKKLLPDTGTAPVNLLNRRHVIHDSTGRTIYRHMPAYYAGTGGGNPLFQTTSRYDALNNMVQTTTPDNGKVQFLYNKVGQLRFQQDEDGAANGYLGYYKYDQLNRIVEQGIINQQWNAAQLIIDAEVDDFPKSLAGQQIQKSLTYTSYLDGDIALNKVKNSLHYSEDGSGTYFQENYTYNAGGQPAQITTIIHKSDKSIHQYTVGYEYLASGLIAAVIYPSGQGSIGTVYYFYDDLGRLKSIGRSTLDSSFYASYTYTAQNQVSSKILNNGSLTTNHQYLPNGWLYSIQDQGAAQGFNEVINTYSENGSVKSVSDELKGGGADSLLNFSATYNLNNLLNAVEYNTESDWSFTDMNYDTNGNLLSLTANGSDETYVYQAGTNQVNQVTKNGGEILAVQYNVNGGVSRTDAMGDNGKGKVFTYLKNGYLTSKIEDESSGENHCYYYGSKGRRILKQTIANEKVMSEKVGIFGSYSLPLMEISDEGTMTYIYGPSGLIAFEKKSTLYFVSKDHLGSNRMVFDSTNKVAAVYSYSSFGENKIIYESEPGLLGYLYTGQEWLPEVGLYNFRARLYDARLKRFYQTDPRYQFVGAYIFNGQNPLTFTDPTGMWSFLDIFSEIAQWIIDAVEIIVGIVADVISLGFASEVGGGTLIGAGLNSMASIIEANAKGEPLSWLKFGEAQVVGEITGSVSAGIGALGDIFAGMVSEGVSSLADAAISDAVKTGVNIAFKVVVSGPIGGIVSNVAGTFTSNLFAVGEGEQGASLDEGLGSAAWVGAVMGVVGSGLGEAGGGISKNMAKPGKIFVGLAAGIVTGGVGGLVTWADKKGAFSWLNFGINISSGMVEAFSGSLKSANAPEDPQAVIAAQQARTALLSDQDDVYGGRNDIEMTPFSTRF